MDLDFAFIFSSFWGQFCSLTTVPWHTHVLSIPLFYSYLLILLLHLSFLFNQLLHHHLLMSFPLFIILLCLLIKRKYPSGIWKLCYMSDQCRYRLYTTGGSETGDLWLVGLPGMLSQSAQTLGKTQTVVLFWNFLQRISPLHQRHPERLRYEKT